MSAEQKVNAEIGSVEIDPDMTLRRIRICSPNPEGIVLFLHGFPETLYAWKDIALALATEYDVHAFDWPGYGLSSRPPVDRFSYAPKDYARILKEYIAKAGIDTSRLVIYATGIGALPALLLALDEPRLAHRVIVGDFAPFDRPQYMHENLQSLKSQSTSDRARSAMNRNRDEILENAFRRGLERHEQFELPRDFKEDMRRGWNQGDLTSADAFYHYYSHFSRDQRYFEVNVERLEVPIKVVWGERDFYIKKEMGEEFARKANLQLILLPDLGHTHTSRARQRPSKKFEARSLRGEPARHDRQQPRFDALRGSACSRPHCYEKRNSRLQRWPFIRRTESPTLLSLSTRFAHRKESTMNRSVLILAAALSLGGIAAHAESPDPSGQYAHPMTSTLSRAQVRAELQQAVRDGNVTRPGESGLTDYEVRPLAYPARTMVAGKTREQVRAETLEAISNGDVLLAGESGLTRRELSAKAHGAREWSTRQAAVALARQSDN